MNRPVFPSSRTALSALALALLMAACGGGGDAVPESLSVAQAAAADPIAPLLDDEGRAMAALPGTEPSDPGARTRTGHYATAQQAAQLESALGSGVVILTVEPSPDGPSAAVELAVMTAYAWQAAHGLDTQAPVLVRGPDLRLAAAAADHLGDTGHSRVFLVTR